MSSNIRKKLKLTLWDLKILIVEDDKAILDYLQLRLSQFCENIDTATNGEEAFNIYQNNYYDLIITDLEMPVKNGFWFIEQVREQSFQKPILVTTAFSDYAHVLQCLELGVSGFIPKPIILDDFLRTLYEFSKVLHEKKVTFQYQQEMEKYMKASFIKEKQFKTLLKALEQTLSSDQKEFILQNFQKEGILAPRFLLEAKKQEKKIVEEITSPIIDDGSFDEFKKDDLQRFYESEEDIEDYMSKILTIPESVTDYFPLIAKELYNLGEVIAKYPSYNMLTNKLDELATVLENIETEVDIQKFSYLFESFMDSLHKWSKDVLGGENIEFKVDIYSVMHDIDILCNAFDAKVDYNESELELF